MAKRQKRQAPLASKLQSIMLISFAMLCLIFALIFSTGSGKAYQTTLPSSGGLIGPIEIKGKNNVFQIDIKQVVNDGYWSYVDVEVLNENQEYLYSFGKELWSESGYDDEGHWSESVNTYDMKMTVKEPGTYFFKLSTESNQNYSANISVKIQKKLGSSLAFFTAGMIAILLGLANDFFRSALFFR